MCLSFNLTHIVTVAVRLWVSRTRQLWVLLLGICSVVVKGDCWTLVEECTLLSALLVVDLSDIYQLPLSFSPF